MKHPEHYRGKEVVVIGLARSGVAVARLFREYGALVTVNDRKKREECQEVEDLEALGISVVCGGHPPELIHGGVSLVVKNPGIPYTAEPIVRAFELGIEVVTEVEVAWHVCPAPIIGITGSNGKTTTTTWVGKMLELGGLKPIVAGNIGIPLSDAARDAERDNWLVAELSSFQLKGTVHFRPNIACLLNLYETHLDYHGTMEDYAASKAKLFANQSPEDTAVLNWDDPFCRQLIPQLKARILPFSMKEQLDVGVFLEWRDGRRWIVWRTPDGRTESLVPADEVGIPGEFNIQNALAAAAVAQAAGVPAEKVAAAVRAFRGVEHRLEWVREKDGVVYYNNSKATNPAATIAALGALDRPVVLIAGGLERNMDYTDLIPSLKQKVKAVVAIGQTREKIRQVAELAGISKVKVVDTATNAAEIIDEAVKAASAFAEAGDIVLLSPACASWDMFASYEERGSMFKQSVHNL